MEARCRQDSEVYYRKALALGLTVLLAVVSSHAAAEWVQVGSGENVTAYADPATIRRTGDKVKMWRLLDFKTTRVSNATGKLFRSSKGQGEYDCKEEQERTLYFSWHSGNWGEGETVISNSNVDNWAPVPPGTLNQSLWEFACGKR